MVSSKSSDKNYVCLVCLKRFRKLLLPTDVPDADIKIEPVNDDASNSEDIGHHPQDSSSISSKAKQVPEKDEDEISPLNTEPKSSSFHLPDLYTRFLRFSDTYFKLRTTIEVLTYFAKQLKNERGNNIKIQAFCADCEIYVAGICSLHAEIKVLQLKLLNKVGTLGDMMQKSTRKVSVKLERGLVKTLGEQLNVKTIAQVYRFRKALQNQCKNRGKRCAPKVLVHRGLCPDQWKFTYSATKQTLMRLIIIFGLASTRSPKSTETKVTATQKENEQKNEKGPRRRRPRKNRTNAKSEVKQEVEENGSEEADDKVGIDDDDFDDKQPDPFGGDSDPDWSTNDGPVSPISNASSDPDFEETPSKRTRTSKTNSNNSEDTPPPKRRRHRKLGTSASSVNSKEIQCSKCSNVFKNYVGLKQHMKKMHHVIIQIPCTECGLKMKNAKEMFLHKQRVHNKRRRPENSNSEFRRLIGTGVRECQVCSKVFSKATDLARHRKTHYNRPTDNNNILIDFENPEPSDDVKNDPKREKKTRLKRRKFGERKPRPLTKEELNILENEKMKIRFCEICDTDENTSFLLRKHLETVHELEDDKPLSCFFCYQKFTVKQTRDLHVIATHTTYYREVFDCDDEDCNSSFKTWDELHQHLKEHLSKKKDSEDQPSSTGDNECVTKTSQEPSTSPSTSRQIHYCPTCGLGFLAEGLVPAHQTRHTPKVDGVYHCSKCIQTFEIVSHLHKHFNMVHGHHILAYKCKICDHRCMSKRALIEHTKNHHDNTDRQVACEEEGCDKKFCGTYKLTLHLYRFHKKGKIYNCDECGKSFHWPCLLKFHKKSHLDPGFECNICNKKFKRRLTMESHKSKKHAEEEDTTGHLKCTEPDCDKLFVTQHLLKRHVIRIHQRGGNGLMCQKCGAISLTKGDLMQHMRTHEPAKLECEICHKLFRRGFSLNLHMNSIHNANRVMEEHICEECGMIFNSKTGLRYHCESIHTPESEKKHACPNCPRRYHRLALLHLHLKNCKNGEGKESNEKVKVIPLKPKARGLNVKMVKNNVKRGRRKQAEDEESSTAEDTNNASDNSSHNQVLSANEVVNSNDPGFLQQLQGVQQQQTPTTYTNNTSQLGGVMAFPPTEPSGQHLHQQPQQTPFSYHQQHHQ